MFSSSLTSTAIPPGAAFGDEVGYVEDPARACGDNRHARTGKAIGAAFLLDGLSALGVQELGPLLDRRLGVDRLDRTGKGGIGPDQGAVAVSKPGRTGKAIEDRAQRLQFTGLRFMLAGEKGVGAPLSGQVANAHDRGAGGNPAAHLDQTIGGGGQHETKRLAVAAQALDRMLQPLRLTRLQPGAEGKQPGGGTGNAGRLVENARDHGLLSVTPDHDALVIGGNQALEPVKARGQRRALLAGGREISAGGTVVPEKGNGRCDREGHRTADGGDPDDLGRIEGKGRHPVGSGCGSLRGGADRR